MINQFFNEHHLKYAPETASGYKISLTQFFCHYPKQYNQVEANDIREWLAELGKAGLKPSSIRIKLIALKVFYNFCSEEALVNQNPAKNIHSPWQPMNPVYLSKKDLIGLMETASSSFDRAIIETLYATGVRVSELVTIQLADIKWDTWQVLIKGKGKRERVVLFTAACAQRLQEYLASHQVESPYLFADHKGRPVSTAKVRQIVKSTAQKLYLGYKVTPHNLRHTFAAHLRAKGMSLACLQDLLGHEDIKNTRIYTRLVSQASKNKYDKYC
ncbi:tyrosine-type recombinase/integrase [Desulfotruncus alcoholivorax]|uniref:tyrosine-type recombinase/integrase n=1 Tax=Desulfotruncus alcoholivorax TaxID=265477 RepID=UPI001A99674C|nr:tyrosine-type recombinase/integrase [Desulfotruncus alcoholivorax]